MLLPCMVLSRLALLLVPERAAPPLMPVWCSCEPGLVWCAVCAALRQHNSAHTARLLVAIPVALVPLWHLWVQHLPIRPALRRCLALWAPRGRLPRLLVREDWPGVHSAPSRVYDAVEGAFACEFTCSLPG